MTLIGIVKHLITEFRWLIWLFIMFGILAKHYKQSVNGEGNQ